MYLTCLNTNYLVFLFYKDKEIYFSKKLQLQLLTKMH